VHSRQGDGKEELMLGGREHFLAPKLRVEASWGGLCRRVPGSRHGDLDCGAAMPAVRGSGEANGCGGGERGALEGHGTSCASRCPFACRGGCGARTGFLARAHWVWGCQGDDAERCCRLWPKPLQVLFCQLGPALPRRFKKRFVLEVADRAALLCHGCAAVRCRAHPRNAVRCRTNRGKVSGLTQRDAEARLFL
jgi:hypothetical protein